MVCFNYNGNSKACFTGHTYSRCLVSICKLSVGIRMSFIIYISCQILLGDQMKNKMGWACGTYGGRGGEAEICTVFWLGKLKEREHLEDLG